MTSDEVRPAGGERGLNERTPKDSVVFNDSRGTLIEVP